MAFRESCDLKASLNLTAIQRTQAIKEITKVKVKSADSYVILEALIDRNLWALHDYPILKKFLDSLSTPVDELIFALLEPSVASSVPIDYKKFRERVINLLTDSLQDWSIPNSDRDEDDELHLVASKLGRFSKVKCYKQVYAILAKHHTVIYQEVHPQILEPEASKSPQNLD